MKPKIYFATDHSGIALKDALVVFLRDELGYEVEDCGAYELDIADDYPDFVHKAAQAVSENPSGACAIVIGASGQGEAMVANRYEGVRAALYYGAAEKSQTDASGKDLSMIKSTRVHNAANVLSLAARFVDEAEAKKAVQEWLETPPADEERHLRRIQKIEIVLFN